MKVRIRSRGHAGFIIAILVVCILLLCRSGSAQASIGIEGITVYQPWREIQTTFLNYSWCNKNQTSSVCANTLIPNIIRKPRLMIFLRQTELIVNAAEHQRPYQNWKTSFFRFFSRERPACNIPVNFLLRHAWSNRDNSWLPRKNGEATTIRASAALPFLEIPAKPLQFLPDIAWTAINRGQNFKIWKDIQGRIVSLVLEGKFQSEMQPIIGKLTPLNIYINHDPRAPTRNKSVFGYICGCLRRLCSCCRNSFLPIKSANLNNGHDAQANSRNDKPKSEYRNRIGKHELPNGGFNVLILILVAIFLFSGGLLLAVVCRWLR
jgi:hypothetical protein